jgi:hypothetical protein
LYDSIKSKINHEPLYIMSNRQEIWWILYFLCNSIFAYIFMCLIFFIEST